MAAPTLTNPSNLGNVAPDRIAQNFANASVITPSDTVADFASQPFDVYVGVTGDVTAVPWLAGQAGTAVLFKSVPAGTRLPCRIGRVAATGTTATNLLALY